METWQEVTIRVNREAEEVVSNLLIELGRLLVRRRDASQAVPGYHDGSGSGKLRLCHGTVGASSGDGRGKAVAMPRSCLQCEVVPAVLGVCGQGKAGGYCPVRTHPRGGDGLEQRGSFV